MTIIIFLFLSGAITIGLTRSELLDEVKEKLISFLPLGLDRYIGTLLFCTQCLGFWIGLILSIFISPSWIGIYPVVDNILAAFAASYISTLMDLVVYGRAKDE